MGKNIIISEGSQAKNFMSVAKIRTNLIGGGTQNWVPEDEAGMYANLGVAEIDKNGTYKASDEDLDGFSQVTVSVQPKTATKTITKNGTYKASKDKVDGYSEVSVQVPEGGGGELVTKNITENGTYNASDDNADGYSSVTVNVSGGGSLITKQITANGTYNAQDDNASGYSSVTVNVQATHSRSLVGGLNNAPVNSKISVHDFLADLSEQTYAAGMSYFANNAQMQAFLENTIRTGDWYKTGLLNIPDIENYDLVMVGAGGFTNINVSRYDITIWVEIIGILDDSATVTLSNMDIHSFDMLLSEGSKFTNRHGSIGYIGYAGRASGTSAAFNAVKEDINNHSAGASGAISYNVEHGSGGYAILTNLPHTPVLTNLTGGTIA